MRDLPNLDFVRSVAVVSVIVEHVLLALGISWIGPFQVGALGICGVFLFFVLTALVLMWSLERKPHTLDFYIRRFFRIYPLAIVCIAAAFLFHAPTAGTPTAPFQYLPITGPALIKNFLLVFQLHDWSLGVLWSLSYEVKMYLLLPMIFFFVRRDFTLWPVVVLWALVVFSTHHGPVQEPNFGVALAYFLPGVMAYVGFARWKPILPGWSLPIVLLALFTYALLRFNFHQTAWAFCLLVGLALPLFRQIRSRACVIASRQIAKYSYGIYLTHPFAIVIGLYLLRGHGMVVRFAAMLGPLILLPLLAYHLIEHPMIRLGSRLAAMIETKYERREMKATFQQPVA